MDIKTIVLTVVKYFVEMFLYWGIIPEEYADEIADGLGKLETAE